MYSKGVVMEHSKSNNTGVSYKTIHIESDLYSKIGEIAKKHDTNLRRYLNDTISDIIQREELMIRISPFLEIVATQEKSMFIKDQKDKGKVFEIVISKEDDDNDNKLKVQCLQEESDSCVHVAYALGFLSSNVLGRLLYQ